MKKFLIFTSFSLAIFIAACSTSQMLTYRPVGSNEKLWEIHVEKSSLTDQFQVIIDDSTVIAETPNIFTKTVESKCTFRNKEIKLIVNHSEGTLGIGEGYNALLLIDNEMAGQFKF